LIVMLLNQKGEIVVIISNLDLCDWLQWYSHLEHSHGHLRWPANFEPFSLIRSEWTYKEKNW
jgi:hypothetical protein